MSGRFVGLRGDRGHKGESAGELIRRAGRFREEEASASLPPYDVLKDEPSAWKELALWGEPKELFVLGTQAKGLFTLRTRAADSGLGNELGKVRSRVGGCQRLRGRAHRRVRGAAGGPNPRPKNSFFPPCRRLFGGVAKRLTRSARAQVLGRRFTRRGNNVTPLSENVEGQPHAGKVFRPPIQGYSRRTTPPR